MATENKDFKIKNGLIVQGTTATVDGNDILTTASDISDFSNVDLTGLQAGNTIVWNETSQTWFPGAASGGTGGGNYTISDTPPVGPSAGDVWFSSTDGRSYIYYADGDSAQWIEIGGVAGPQGPPGPQGSAGADGIDGDSGYQVAVDNGFVGTEQEWLDSLVGPQGPQGIQGIQGETGATGDTGPAGADGLDGADGDSAYEVAVTNGFVGTEAAWLNSLIGEQGSQGPQGIPGETGLQGETGPAGPGLAAGGTTGQIAAKASNSDYDTEWVTPVYDLANLTDTNVGSVADGDALVYDSATGKWIPGDAGGKFTVSDTAPVAPENGDTWFNSSNGKTFIYYVDVDSSQWVEIASAVGPELAVGDLSNVVITSPSTGQALTFDGTQWVNSTLVDPPVTLTELTDTTLSSPQNGEVLKYNGSQWINDTIEEPNYASDQAILAAQIFG